MKVFISEYGMVIVQSIGAACVLGILWQFFDHTFMQLVIHCVESIIG